MAAAAVEASEGQVRLLEVEQRLAGGQVHDREDRDREDEELVGRALQIFARRFDRNHAAGFALRCAGPAGVRRT